MSADTSAEQTANSKESEYTLQRGRPEDPFGADARRARSLTYGGRASVDSFRSAGSEKSCKMCKTSIPSKISVSCINCHRRMCLNCCDRCPLMEEGCNFAELCPTCRPPRSHRCQGLAIQALKREKELEKEMAKKEADMKIQQAEMKAKMIEDKMNMENEMKEKELQMLRAQAETMNVENDRKLAAARQQVEQNAKALADQQRAAEEAERNLKAEAIQHIDQQQMTLETERAARSDAEQRGRAHVQMAEQSKAAAEDRARSTSAQSSRIITQCQNEIIALKQALAEREQQHAEERQSYMNSAAQDYQDQLERQRRESERIAEEARTAERERMTKLMNERDRGDQQIPETASPRQPTEQHDQEEIRRCYICPAGVVEDCQSCKRGICKDHCNPTSKRCPHCEERRATMIITKQLKAEQKRISEKLLALADRRRDRASGSEFPPPPQFGSADEATALKAAMTAKRAKRTMAASPGGDGGDEEPEDEDDDPDDDRWHDAQSIAPEDLAAIVEASEDETDAEKDDSGKKKKPPRKPNGDDDGDPPPGGGGPGPPPPGGGGPGGTPPGGGPSGTPNPSGGPSGPPNGGGGGGGGGDGDPDDPAGAVVPGQGNTDRDLLIINRENEISLKIQDFPSVVGREDWQKILARSVAQSSRHHDDAYKWIMAAIMLGPSCVPDNDLKQTGDDRFKKIDMRLGVLILEKAQGIKSKRNHKDANILEMSDRICELEHNAYNEPRLMTGREMVRFIVRFQSCQESWQQYFQFNDLMDLKFEYKGEKANRELGNWVAEWNSAYQRVEGIEDTKFQLLALTHFYNQVRYVESIAHITNQYYFCKDDPGTGEKTYQWLRTNIAEFLNKRRLERNREEQKKGLLKQVNGRGGPAAPGEKGDGKGKPTWDPKTIPCKHHLRGSCLKGRNCEYLHQGQAGSKGKKGDGKGKKGEGKGKKGRPGAPGEQATTPTQPAVPATQKNPCYAFSRNDCKDPNCQKKRVHRKLTPEEIERRNDWEKRMIAEGKTIPYRTPLAAPAPNPKAKPNAKAKPKPTAAKKLCKFIKQGKTCPQGDACHFPHA